MKNLDGYLRRAFVVLLIAGLVACFSDFASADAIDVDAAKKEGKVVVYGTIPPKAIDPLLKAFQNKYGIQVEYWRGSSTKVLDRALTEWRAGRPGFDVVEGNRGAHLILRDAGIYQAFVPPSAKKFPEQFHSKDGLFNPWRILPLSILYNTDFVKPDQAPKDFKALLDPKWKKKISMPDPSRHTTTAQFLSNMDKYFGNKADEWIRGMAKQEPHFTVSLSPVPRAVISGEAHVGITYIKYLIQFPGPMDYVRLDKYLADDNSVALSKKAAHPNAGKLYMEFASSAEGQKIIAEKGEFALHPDANPPIKGAEQVVAKTVFMDVPSGEEFKKLKNQWREVFFGR